jgi:hypothetical protein
VVFGDSAVMRKVFVKVGTRALLALFGIFLAAPANAQGTLRAVTFDGPPAVPSGTGVAVTNYVENGMRFTPINAGEQFSRAGGGRDGFPENGSAYLLQFFSYSLAGSRSSSAVHFGLYSVDLSEFSTLYNYPWTVQFVGYLADGSIVTTEFTTDGIIDGTGPLPDFETFYFDKEFSDIVRFEVPSYGFAMDNLVFFDVVPEPSSILISVTGIVGLWFHSRERMKGRNRVARR